MYTRCVEPCVVRIVESCWNLVNLCLLTLQRCEKDLGIPRRSWMTNGNPPCGWTSATSRTNIWSKIDEGSCVRAKRTTTRRAQLVRSKTSSSCRHTTETGVDDSGHPFAAASLPFPPAAPEVPEDEEEEPAAKPEEDERNAGRPVRHNDTRSFRAQAEVRSAQKHRKPLPWRNG